MGGLRLVVHGLGVEGGGAGGGAAAAAVHVVHLGEEALELRAGGELGPGEGEGGEVGGEHHLHLHLLVRRHRPGPVTVLALQPVTSVAVRTLALVVLRL